MEAKQAKDDAAIVGAAERLAQSAAKTFEQRCMASGLRAPLWATNPFHPGSAAATWWQRGHDKAIAIAKATQ